MDEEEDIKTQSVYNAPENIDEEELENLYEEEDVENDIESNEQDYNPENLKEGFGRDEFSKRVKNQNYYKEEAEKLKTRQTEAKEAKDKAREEKNNEWKKKDLKDENPINDDKSNATQKNLKDKLNDNKNLAKSSIDETKNKALGVGNKINDLKSKAYMAKNPLEAGKAVAKEKAKQKVATLALNLASGKVKIIVAIVLIVILLFFIILFVVLNGDGITGSSSLSSYYSSNTGFWWPIGSKETTDVNGVLFAFGDPEETYITSPFGDTEGRTSPHQGIDIAGNLDDSEGGYYSVIASKSGTVIDVVDYCIIGDISCGGSYGNRIIIDHGDSYTTLYGHLYSVEVEVGDVVEQGQVIAYMGNTGHSTGTHLHFEVRIDGTKVDPENYVSIENARVSGDYDYILNISLTSTSLSKTEFANKLTEYCSSINSDNCTTNFAENSDLIYEASLEAGINPELVVAYAKIEYQFACYDGNCWAIGHGNTESSGDTYDSMLDGLEAFSETVLKYSVEGSSWYTSIEAEKEETISSGCASISYIIPNTLVWTQMKYSSIGTYMYNPGSSSLGGCYYLDYWVSTGFLGYTEDYYNSRCGSSNTCSSSSSSSCSSYVTTVCEESDYAVYTAKQRADIVMDIFYS